MTLLLTSDNDDNRDYNGVVEHDDILNIVHQLDIKHYLAKIFEIKIY